MPYGGNNYRGGNSGGRGGYGGGNRGNYGGGNRGGGYNRGGGQQKQWNDDDAIAALTGFKELLDGFYNDDATKEVIVAIAEYIENNIAKCGLKPFARILRGADPEEAWLVGANQQGGRG